MDFQVTITVDPSTLTSTIVFILGGAEITSYSYDSGVVTMMKRNDDKTMTLAEFNRGVEELDRWIAQLRRLQPSTVTLGNYYLDSMFEDQVLTYNYQTSVISNPGKKKVAMKTAYDFNTKVVTFYARAEIQLEYLDFVLLHGHSRDFLQKIKVINKIM